jgi:xanthine dehydrogenase YagR molybdenum-binding subunit
MVEPSHEEITLTAEPPRAYRAPGHPQGVFAVEMMMDELADRLGLDPLAMRATNESNRRRVEQAKLGADLIGWERRRPFGAARGRYRRGLGMGAAHWHFWPTECMADCTIHRDGRVKIASGVQDIGTGTKTVAVDVAADELGIDRSRITGQVGDSRYPEGPASGGSVTARSLAPAVRDACDMAKQKLLQLVAEEMRVEEGDLRVEGDRIIHADGRSMPWERACALIQGETLSRRGSIKPRHLGEGDTSATQFVDVTVDTQTGIFRVNKVVAVQACGQIVNRKTAENQVCGGVLQGLSYAMFEERLLDPTTGGMLNPNLEWYKISGSFDVPEIVPVLDVDPGDTGVRALGEPTTIPTAGATANAVANAIGARVRSLPITPRKVLAALAEAAATGIAPQGGRS